MKLHRLIAGLMLSMVFGLLPTFAHALTVTVQWYDANGQFVGQVFIEGTATINLDADSPVGGPKAYGPFTIARCSNCPGRARVFVSDGDIDRLILTDAQITNTSLTNGTLKIFVDSGSLTVSGPRGLYPYAAELSGSFVAPIGQSATTPAGNQIRVAMFACSGVPGEGYSGGCTRVDSPELDAGETPANGEHSFCSLPCNSVVAPPYLVAGTSNFAPKENQNVECRGFSDPETEAELCMPALTMNIEVTLRPRHAARLPGSVGAFHVGERCEPDNGLVAGCEKMADLFASLGAKGFKVYEFRMEPTRGAERTIEFRLQAQNSPDAWRTHRGDNHDGNPNEGNNTSSTIVRLESNGVGEVKAKGLCPVSGCMPAGTMLPVKVYCAQEQRTTTAIRLDGKGDGHAEFAFGLPCSDPGVLIMDPSDGYWVAAPVM